MRATSRHENNKERTKSKDSHTSLTTHRMNNSSPASPPRAKLCYYITGHGYGHATRSLKVVETLITKENFDVHVVSSEKTIAFIRSTLSPSILDKMTTHERQLDAGNPYCNGIIFIL
jgi:hypothetical protein